jgi:hypothetical protein
MLPSRWNSDEGDAAFIIPAGDASVPTHVHATPAPTGNGFPGTLGLKQSREAARVAYIGSFFRAGAESCWGELGDEGDASVPTLPLVHLYRDNNVLYRTILFCTS